MPGGGNVAICPLFYLFLFYFEQVRSENLEVRVNTLRVLCEEFKNPATIAGSVKAGLMR